MQPKMIHKQFSSGFVHCHQWSNEIKAYNKILSLPQYSKGDDLSAEYTIN